MRIPLEQAGELLIAGKVVAVPTETVYGLAASIVHPAAVESIYSIKGRPSSNPLIIHVSSLDQIIPYATEIPPFFYELASAFWPGPLTIVLPINTDLVPDKIRAGQPTAAFRIPNHPLVRELIALTGPLVMPSANISGRPSATSPSHVEHDFGADFPVLDGGSSIKGVESTIVIYLSDRWEVIRLGSIPAEEFEPVLGYVPEFKISLDGEKVLCPGQLFRHYAPHSRLLLVTDFPEDLQGTIIGYSDRSYPKGCDVRVLGSLSTPEVCAERLYHVLRQLDEDNVPSVYVDMAIPTTGLWATLRERLNKAAG